VGVKVGTHVDGNCVGTWLGDKVGYGRASDNDTESAYAEQSQWASRDLSNDPSLTASSNDVEM